MMSPHLLCPSPRTLLIKLRHECTVSDGSISPTSRGRADIQPVITSNIVPPLIAITCPAFVSLELRGLRDLCDLLLLYKLSDAPSLSDFPFLAALPSQFIFYNSRRLLVLDNVTLMRQVRGCAPPGSNLLCFFFFWTKVRQCALENASSSFMKTTC